jgi:hypothetical protein
VALWNNSNGTALCCNSMWFINRSNLNCIESGCDLFIFLNYAERFLFLLVVSRRLLPRELSVTIILFLVFATIFILIVLFLVKVLTPVVRFSKNNDNGVRKNWWVKITDRVLCSTYVNGARKTEARGILLGNSLLAMMKPIFASRSARLAPWSSLLVNLKVTSIFSLGWP